VHGDGWMMNVCVVGKDDECLLSGGEGVRGGLYSLSSSLGC